MDVTIVDSQSDKDEMDRVLDAYYKHVEGKLSDEEWYDSNKYPRKQWLIFDGSNGGMRTGESFVVVDNRSGDCFVETFKTLDGAMLYLCDVHTTPEGQEDWDVAGAVSAAGGLYDKEDSSVRVAAPEDDEKWLVRAPVGLTDDFGFVIGYLSRLVPGGATSDVFDVNPENAIKFRSYAEAEMAGRAMLKESFCADANLIEASLVCDEGAWKKEGDAMKPRTLLGAAFGETWF